MVSSFSNLSYVMEMRINGSTGSITVWLTYLEKSTQSAQDVDNLQGQSYHWQLSGETEFNRLQLVNKMSEREREAELEREVKAIIGNSLVRLNSTDCSLLIR